jgi:GNAT superfamily N-acetyltransferase
MGHDAVVDIGEVAVRDISPVADTLARAFFHDPVWGWVFNDDERRTAQLDALWRLLLEGSVGYHWVWAAPEFEAATLWIPPGRPELADPYAARLDPLLVHLVGARRDLVMEVFGRFEAAHPRQQPHYYLSLFGTHPDHRGAGIGMSLLAENLAAVDAERMPAYLESTNPVNVARYESAGFEVCGEFDLPEDGPTVTTMWRDPR